MGSAAVAIKCASAAAASNYLRILTTITCATAAHHREDDMSQTSSPNMQRICCAQCEHPFRTDIFGFETLCPACRLHSTAIPVAKQFLEIPPQGKEIVSDTLLELVDSLFGDMIDIDLAESGADREMDFDRDREIEKYDFNDKALRVIKELNIFRNIGEQNENNLQ